MLKKKWIMTLYLVLALALTACSNDEKAKEPDISTPSEQSSKSLESPYDNQKKYKDIKITASEAYNIFLNAKADSKVEKIALEYDNNAYYYKVEGYDNTNEYELKIDAITGQIIKEEQELNDKRNTEIRLSDLEKIDKLIDKSIEDYKDEFISVEWELSVKNNKLILEVDIEGNNGDIEYTYDLETGNLLKKDK